MRQEVGEQDGRRSSAGGECGPDGKPQGGEATAGASVGRRLCFAVEAWHGAD